MSLSNSLNQSIGHDIPSNDLLRLCIHLVCLRCDLDFPCPQIIHLTLYDAVIFSNIVIVALVTLDDVVHLSHLMSSFLMFFIKAIELALHFLLLACYKVK